VTYITWFDPGVSTGIVRGWFNEEHHYEPREMWQVPGGQEGLIEWLDDRGDWRFGFRGDIIGSEKFIPRPIPGGSHTLESTYPLVQEGLLVGRGIMPAYPHGNWQPATSQVLRRSPDNDPVKNKKLSDELLQDLGLWLTGTDVDRPDANDVNSVTKHIIWFLTRTLKHKPTLEWVYGEEHR
jgi:hypothetical protein